MENSPTPYQRQRRSARYAEQQPAPTVQPMQPMPPVQPVQPVPLRQAQEVIEAAPSPVPPQPRMPSASAPVRQPSGYPQHRAAYPQHPQQGMTPAHQVPVHSGNRPPRALQQRQQNFSDWSMPGQQPAPQQEHTYAAAARRSVPAQPRPTSRSQAMPPQRQQEAIAPQRRAANTRKTPAWLLTALSLLLICVMGLVAIDFLMQAYLKTAADEKQAAYDAILYNYHVTEQADGSLTVTWQELIETYAERYNLNPAFVTAVIRNESSFRTNAESSVGARGLMQMMPDTAQWIAGKLNDPYDFDRLYEAETSIRYGCWYLNYLSELFRGDPVLVAAAYHAGQGEVWGWLGDPAISPDGVTVPIENIPISNTKTYAGRVTQAYGIYQTLLYPQSAASAPSAAVPVGGAAAGLLGSAGR